MEGVSIHGGGDVGSLVWSLHQPHLSIVSRQRQAYKTQGGKVYVRNVLLGADQDVRVFFLKGVFLFDNNYTIFGQSLYENNYKKDSYGMTESSNLDME